MEKTRYSLIMLKERLRTVAAVAAAAAIVLAIIFVYTWIPIITFVILGVLLTVIALVIPWLAGAVMVLMGSWLMWMLHFSNWGIWRLGIYYTSLSVFILAGLLFISAAVVGWCNHDEWPLR